jgi:type IV secretion system protein VirB3
MDKASEDILFLALTRPAMLWGVPAVGCLLNISCSMIAGAWLGMGSYMILVWWVVLIAPIHLTMRVLTAIDHNAFRTKMLWLETKASSAASQRWGGSSLSPLPTRWPTKAREIPISV